MIYSELCNQELVDRTLLGNENAYEALVNRYQYAAIAAAYAVTHDSYFAEDAAQDAFVSAWLKLDTLREGEKFGAWVCRIARNRAKSIMEKHRDTIAYEEVENLKWEAEENFFDYLASPPQYEHLHAGIQNLSEKVKAVIVMHYFEGLSLAEIAERLCVPVGTVKYRLHDGREKLRKELNKDMKEEINETFVEKVMKKVEEIRRWRLKDNKEGFEAFYREVLADLDLLPDSQEKNFALADVLMRGCWWIKGEKNDEVLERIRVAAEKGRNEDAIQMLLGHEQGKLSGKDKIELMRDKQIPRMQENGYKKAEAHLWFWMGRQLFRMGENEKGFEAYQKVLELLSPSDLYYANALVAIEAEKRYEKCADKSMISVNPTAESLRLINGVPRFWAQPGYTHGPLLYMSDFIDSVNWCSSRCDAMFFDPTMKVGDTYIGSDQKSSLTYLCDNATAETACGSFYGCQIWENKKNGITVRTYYKHNIGIVRMEATEGSKQNISVLKSYHIAGGTGLIPLATGNKWEYDLISLNKKAFAYENTYEITDFDGETATLSNFTYAERIGIDTDDWTDNMRYARNHYVIEDEINDKCSTRDVMPQLERAAELAKTTLQKEHTRVATDVMQRILNTDPEFNPDTRVKGMWNFFVYANVEKENGITKFIDTREFSFELKHGPMEHATTAYCILYNHVYSIFEDAMDDCMWNDAWKIGDSGTLKFKHYGMDIETDYCIEGAGTITTAAGTFTHCMRFRINMKNVKGGWHYRGGDMEYYFAPEVGLVRAVHYFHSRRMSATFDLTSYEGTGEGYFPLADGLVRKYDAVGLSDGYEASVEYTCVADENGNLVMLKNKTGIRHLPPEGEEKNEN